MPQWMSRAVLVVCLGMMAGGLTGCATASQASSAPVSANASIAELEEACEAGNIQFACGALGFKYQRGDGVAKDPARATSLLERACTAGRALACSSLGLSYFSGEDVPVDQKRAARLFEQACGGNEAMGCHWRGLALMNGGGVAKDEQGSIPFFEKACKGEYPPACDLLARIHRDGRLVPRNPDRAASLFEKACRLGESEACQAGKIRAGSILIFTAPSMVPSFADRGMSQLWFSFGAQVATHLGTELNRGGLPAQVFVSRDPGQSARQVLLSQLAIHPYDEIIQVAAEHVKQEEGNTVYLVIESFTLQSTVSRDGGRSVTVKDGTSKRFPILSSSGSDLRDVPQERLAAEFAGDFLAGRSSR